MTVQQTSVDPYSRVKAVGLGGVEKFDMNVAYQSDVVDGVRWVTYLAVVRPEKRADVWSRHGDTPLATVFGSIPRDWMLSDDILQCYGLVVRADHTMGICELPSVVRYQAILSEYVGWPTLWQSLYPLRKGGLPSESMAQLMFNDSEDPAVKAYGFDMRNFFGALDADELEVQAGLDNDMSLAGTSVCNVLGNTLNYTCVACHDDYVMPAPRLDGRYSVTEAQLVQASHCWNDLVEPDEGVPVLLVIGPQCHTHREDVVVDSNFTHDCVPGESRYVHAGPPLGSSVDNLTRYELAVRSFNMVLLRVPAGVTLWYNGGKVDSRVGVVVAVVGYAVFHVSDPGGYWLYGLTPAVRLKWMHSVARMDPRDTFSRFFVDLGADVVLVRTGAPRLVLKKKYDEFPLTSVSGTMGAKMFKSAGRVDRTIGLRTGVGTAWVVGTAGSVVHTEGFAKVGSFLFDPDITFAVKEWSYKLTAVGKGKVHVVDSYDEYDFDDGGPSDDEFDCEY